MGGGVEAGGLVGVEVVGGIAAGGLGGVGRVAVLVGGVAFHQA